jgi:hypothetical protein
MKFKHNLENFDAGFIRRKAGASVASVILVNKIVN